MLEYYTHRLNITHSVTTGETTQALRLLGRVHLGVNNGAGHANTHSTALFLSPQPKHPEKIGPQTAAGPHPFVRFSPMRCAPHSITEPRGPPEQYVRCALFSFVVYSRRQQTLQVVHITHNKSKLKN